VDHTCWPAACTADALAVYESPLERPEEGGHDCIREYQRSTASCAEDALPFSIGPWRHEPTYVPRPVVGQSMQLKCAYACPRNGQRPHLLDGGSCPHERIITQLEGRLQRRPASYLLTSLDFAYIL
jgi:hypothetical protein